MNHKSYVHQISEIGPRERVRLRVSASAVASERRCVGVDRRCRESEGKAKIEGYMSVSDEEAHQRCHHKRGNSNVDMILMLYVDDLLLLGENLSKIENIKHQLGKLYQMKDLRPASSYLGI